MGFVPQFFTKRCGPGYLTGIALEDWLRLLDENHYAVESSYWIRGAAITAYSGLTSLVRKLEEWRFERRIRQLEVPPPLFILGHWRSGTTHLHNLLALDQRFGYPNSFQALHPHTFLLTEGLLSFLTAPFLPARRPMDNVPMGYQLPQEDEFALVTLSRMSPYLGWCWPERAEHYDQYLTLREVPAVEVAQWQAALKWFVQKLTFKCGRPLLLKSPPHTCRIRLLLEMFPQARFVHLYRNPFTVFQSTRKMFWKVGQFSQLQCDDAHKLDERIIRNYRAMYDVYFDECGLIAEGRLHELAFEDLEKDPMRQLELLYERLQLGEFGAVEPSLRNYLGSVSDYQKNRFGGLPTELRGRIARQWKRTFDEWGYPTGDAGDCQGHCGPPRGAGDRATVPVG